MSIYKSDKTFTREDVSEIVRQRVNKLNEHIEALELENTLLRKELERYERRDKDGD